MENTTDIRLFRRITLSICDPNANFDDINIKDQSAPNVVIMQ